MNFLIDISFGEDLILWPRQVRLAAGVERLGDLRDKHVREMTHVPDPRELEERELIMETLRDSVRKRERLWLLTMTDAQIGAWKTWVDASLLHELGPKQSAREHEVTPIGIAPRLLIDFLLERRTKADKLFLTGALHGLDSLLISARAAKQLQQLGIQLQPRSVLVRLFTNAKFLAYLVVLAYSALRVLPVMFVREFEGSLVMLWAIDLLTAIPYTWGLLTMVTAPRFAKRMLGMVVTIATFMAPYVYFGLHGRGYPPHVIGIIAMLIMGTFALEGFKAWMDRKAYKSLAKVAAPRRSRRSRWKRPKGRRKHLLH
ncbi:hypothetical protein QP400_09710 [Winkia sp. UMB3158]|uniref:hypothetical protein n=1 Tax=Winkia TaxID=2692118 RepID=UPI00065F9CB3|nr:MULTISPECIES: hypothetical protein [Winkia]MDK8341377.1 hypothetical protein [Winkia sp. UMB3164B]OFT37378.1 hypothetical protein HMPREF3163_09190 [Actinomyces sp. HMSC08A01]PMC93170.1 hypothetical protein CJ188_05140 [Actinomyces sp. UMB0918]MBS5948061.1 hypothetical protein [Winkia neuii]MCG7302070.1 hypothetical protein [Winkia sp. ACRQY]